MLLVMLWAMSTVALNAQEIATWIGGTPGRANDWNTAQNWSPQRVPGELSVVVIKSANNGHNAQPVIANGVEVAAVELYAGAVLTITPNGYLAIDGTDTYSEGLSLFGGYLENKGKVTLSNIDEQFIDLDSFMAYRVEVLEE